MIFRVALRILRYLLMQAGDIMDAFSGALFAALPLQSPPSFRAVAPSSSLSSSAMTIDSASASLSSSAGKAASTLPSSVLSGDALFLLRAHARLLSADAINNVFHSSIAQLGYVVSWRVQSFIHPRTLISLAFCFVSTHASSAQIRFRPVFRARLVFHRHIDFRRRRRECQARPCAAATATVEQHWPRLVLWQLWLRSAQDCRVRILCGVVRVV